MNEANLPDLAGSDRVIQSDADDIDAVIRPVRALVYVGCSMHVAAGEMEFDIEIVISATQIVVPGRDPQTQQAHRASSTLQQCGRLGADQNPSVICSLGKTRRGREQTNCQYHEAALNCSQ